jgi:hypothetical protein
MLAPMFHWPGPNSGGIQGVCGARHGGGARLRALRVTSTLTDSSAMGRPHARVSSAIRISNSEDRKLPQRKRPVTAKQVVMQIAGRLQQDAVAVVSPSADDLGSVG